MPSLDTTCHSLVEVTLGQTSGALNHPDTLSGFGCQVSSSHTSALAENNTLADLRTSL